MPKEKKKRGRREAQKRAEEEVIEEERRDEEVDGPVAKRARFEAGPALPSQEDYFRTDLDQDNLVTGQDGETAFYGLLNESEQEYFRQTSSLLELDEFETREQRDLFLENVYKEASGKELKIACSQSCSRFMERLVALSSPAQLKTLYTKFTGHFPNLAQHRFASHCCETLLSNSIKVIQEEAEASIISEDDNLSMVDLIVSMGRELQPDLTFFLTDVFASHVIRVLLLVLVGKQPDLGTPVVSGAAGKRKEKAVRQVGDSWTLDFVPPEMFTSFLLELINNAIMAMETEQLRSLASHPTANPVLQLILEIELRKTQKRQASQGGSILLHKILPIDRSDDETSTPAFLKHLLFDAIGSRLLETIICYAPGKMFKYTYNQLFRENMSSICKNEVASFSITKLLERLSREDLARSSAEIEVSIATLFDRSQTNILKTLIERHRVRGLEVTSLADRIVEACGSRNLLEILHLYPPNCVATLSKQQTTSSTVSSSNIKTHASLLIQTMLSHPDALQKLVHTALLSIPSHTTNGDATLTSTTTTTEPVIDKGVGIDLHTPVPTTSYATIPLLARSRATSHLLQSALLAPETPIAFHRKLIPQFLPDISLTAQDPFGSHVFDALWTITTNGTNAKGLRFLRANLATALVSHESVLRANPSGRAVWRNWKLDLYKRGHTWPPIEDDNPSAQAHSQAIETSKQSQTYAQPQQSHGRLGNTQSQTNGGVKTKQKTNLELARDRHAAANARAVRKAAMATAAVATSSS